MIVTLSLSMRVLVNTEALNMAEAVGGYTRHRKAPVVVASSGSYSVVYVPAVSGEALAHSYQVLLTQLAKERGLPVTKLDELGYFLKFPQVDILDDWYPELKQYTGGQTVKEWASKASLGELEKAVLKSSIVADVGGFLLSDKSLKRTSAIRFSCMVPTLDAVESGGAAIMPQLHVRYAPPELQKKLQRPFHVESGSALYTFTAELVATDISALFYARDRDAVLESQRLKRVETAIDALIALVDGVLFGAKRSRYMPLWNVKSLVVTVSEGPVEFVASPGLTKTYVKETYDRAIVLTKSIPEETVNIYAYISEEIPEPTPRPDIKNVTFTKTSTHTEALAEAKTKLINVLSVLQIIK